MTASNRPPPDDDESLPACYDVRIQAASLRSASDDGRRGKQHTFRYGSWRHVLGMTCLLITVFLWTASNFLASNILADNTYSKPYLVTYINTAFFVLPLLPMGVWQLYKDPSQLSRIGQLLRERPKGYSLVSQETRENDDHEAQDRTAVKAPSERSLGDAIHGRLAEPPSSNRLTLRETARLSLEFCALWFAANYFVIACLEHTSVASSTILTSTSGVWTLAAGAALGVERFTCRKLGGVLASLAGIALIASADLSGASDEQRGRFPHKDPRELAAGNAMALLSAVLYGAYAVLLKRRVGDESRISIALFFGLVGVWNVLLLWPGLVVLHFAGVERFEAPPTPRVTAIILINAAASLVSDVSWALAMLFTSPLLVTVGLSLTIPLSLVGQAVLSSQYSGPLYWVGACVVVLSFIFINREESRDGVGRAAQEEEEERRRRQQ